MSESSDRLAHTRLAIIEHIQKKQERRSSLGDKLRSVAALAGFGRSSERAPPVSRDSGLPDYTRPGVPGNDPASRKERRARSLFNGRMGAVGEAAAGYWKNHPVRLAVELATPTLSRFAQRRPVIFLAASAAAGAVIYVTRPWRLISVTGLALAALRSPQVSGALISAFYSDRADEKLPD